MKVYTRKGDRGETNLFSGERVSKHHIRVETYGAIDELNSVIGATAASLAERQAELVEELRAIQINLLRIGSWLATTPESPNQNRVQYITEADCRALEQTIDRLEAELSELHGFVLPGGHPTAAWAHIARTVCRRAERYLVGLYEHECPAQDDVVFEQAIGYLNRLSDYFFILARTCNQRFGQADILWKS